MIKLNTTFVLEESASTPCISFWPERKRGPIRRPANRSPCAIRTRRTARIFEWTPALQQAVAQAKAARPIDFSPWLFCTRKGEGYFNEDSGQATGWDSMWQRFMTRLLEETDIEERFTEHDLRGKVGSDLASIERAADLLGHTSKEITKRHYRRKPEVIKPVR